MEDLPTPFYVKFSLVEKITLLTKDNYFKDNVLIQHLYLLIYEISISIFADGKVSNLL